MSRRPRGTRRPAAPVSTDQATHANLAEERGD